MKGKRRQNKPVKVQMTLRIVTSPRAKRLEADLERAAVEAKRLKREVDELNRDVRLGRADKWFRFRKTK